MEFKEGIRWVVERLEDLRLRLQGVRMPSLSIPIIAAASADAIALNLLERGIAVATAHLLDKIAILAGNTISLDQADQIQLSRMNMLLNLLQLEADALFRTLDMFQDALFTRSDAHVGLMLAGTDVIINAALHRTVKGYMPPYGMSYMDSATRGGAITRARTHLPGGVNLHVALIRVTPETLPTRLTSALHEVGHQLSVDLEMLEEAGGVITRVAAEVTNSDECGRLFAEWTSELLADCWGYCLSGGAAGIDGLQRVLSLPAPLLQMVRSGDPHPPGNVRVIFGLMFSNVVYPDPILRRLAQRFYQVYPNNHASSLSTKFPQANMAAEKIAMELAEHRFTGLGGSKIKDVCDPSNVCPSELRKHLDHGSGLTPHKLGMLPPLTALALLGYGRVCGIVSQQQHQTIAQRWLQDLAFREYRRRDVFITGGRGKKSHAVHRPLPQTI